MRIRTGFGIASLFLFALAFYNTPSLADTSVSGRISTDTTWTLANSPYLVTSTVQVYGTSTTPVTLTVEPGVVVKFNSGMGLQIGDSTNLGSLVSQGTSTNHITFTRSGTSGTWSGLTFNDKTVDAATILEYADVQYSTGVTMNSASPTIRNSTITNLTGYVNLNSSNPTLDTVTIANTGSYGIYLSSSSPTITNGSLTNSSATGHGIYGSGSPVISNYSISIVNTALKYGAYFSSSSSGLSITNSNIANGLYIGSLNIAPTVTGNTFTNANNSPIHAGANIIGQIMNDNAVNNMTSAGKIEVAGEQVKQDAHWTLWPAPYVVVSGSVSVYKDATGPATLTIDPGVSIKFASGSGLTIGNGSNQGALVAQGTAANHIAFTRSGTSGTWSSITFNDGTIDGTTDLEYVDVQYCTGVTMYSASPAIRNSTISINNSGGNGLTLNTSNPTLENVTITHDGTIGLSLSSSSLILAGGSLTNTNAAGQGINGSGSPAISNYSVSIVNTANKYGVYLSSGSTSALSITNSTIANGLYIGSTGITPTITGNTFTNVDNSPIHSGANITAQILNNNTINGMTSAGKIEVAGEQVKQDAHWTLWPAPYIVVSGTVSVYKDTTGPATLTIDPGVTIKFASNSGLQVGNGASQGALAAQGTAANRITFTRNGTSGTWSGLNFQDGTIDNTTDLEYTDIQYSTGVAMNYASPVIRNSTITDVTGYGLNLTYSSPTLDTVTISNNGTYGINLAGSSSPVIANGSLTNTNATGQGIYGGGSPVISNYSISIVNTALKYGAYFSSSSSSLSITNSNIANGLYIGSTSITPTITGNTFTNSDNSPIHAGANIIGQIMNNNTVNNMTGAGKIEVVGEVISQDARWQKWAAPYIALSGMIYVYKDTSSAATLTLDPGVTVKFSTGTAFQVGSGSSRGVLVARGTANNKILFTSSQATPAPGNWNGVTLSGDASSASDLEYTTIEYAGTGANYSNADLTISSSAPVLRNCLIRNSAGSGVYLTNSPSYPVIIDSEINGNKWGVYSNASNPYITNTKIYSNTTYGVNNATTTMDVDARDNWWGAATGPLYSGNSQGTGDKINDHVLYNPWLGQTPGVTLSITDAKVLPASLNPNGDYVMFTASISSSATWTIAITDSNNAAVRSFSGSGTSINQQWNGENSQSVKVADGLYYYQISATDPANGNTASTPQGIVMVSRQIPVAILTLPTDNQMFPSGTTINITGTASDADFHDYTLDYGVGENPSSWTNLKSATTTSVTNGLIYAWNTTSLTGSSYTVKLTVTDNANNVSVETSRVRFIWIQNAAASEAYISPNGDGVKDSSSISAAFTQQSNWTITMKNSTGTAVRTYSGTALSVNQAWDGKDSSNQVVPDGTYTWQIDAVSPETNVAAAPKTGTIIVDATGPVAQIASPTSGSSVLNIVQITGTASDANFDNYKIEYGPAAGSGPWTQIATGTTSTSGALATWITNDVTNTVLLQNSGYTLRLTASDKAGNSSVVALPVTVNNLMLSNISISSHSIDMLASQSSSIFYTINSAATVTLKIIPEKQGPTGAPIYQSAQTVTAAGASSFTWDGKDNNDQVVADEAYLYILEASDGTRTDSYNPPVPIDAGYVSCDREENFYPIKNDPLTITYNLTAVARVDIKISWGSQNFSILSAAPAAAGTHTFDWDGRNPVDMILDSGAVVSCSIASRIRENHIITNGNTVRVSYLKTDPYTTHLSYGQFSKISYTLSRDAIVNISILSPSGSSNTIVNNEPQSQGPQSIEWRAIDPGDSTGKQLQINEEGVYTIVVRTTNPETGMISTAKNCLTVLY